ncbi:armadillo-type protein [Fomitopsis serialis]|uniref:armadillo-type protein n=1 Tax=Fomitopsis serialis TaxID=139415 RepID=UPI00200766EF|nr:armadillo-type protein [Neoantrodia serialis]KAH9910720.1 armadillo-type protein [Neoantrodia serialis]
MSALFLSNAYTGATLCRRYGELWRWDEWLLRQAIIPASRLCVHKQGGNASIWTLLDKYHSCSSHWPPTFRSAQRSTITVLHLHTFVLRAHALQAEAVIRTSRDGTEKAHRWISAARSVEYRTILTASTQFPKAGERNIQADDLATSVSQCVRQVVQSAMYGYGDAELANRTFRLRHNDPVFASITPAQENHEQLKEDWRKSDATMTLHITIRPGALGGNRSLKAAVAPADGQFDDSGLFVADKATHESAATTLAALAQKDGPKALQSVGFNDAAIKALSDKKSPTAREGAANTVAVITKSDAVKALEPLFIDSGLYAALLECFADKMPAVRTAAIDAVKAYVIKTVGKWQVKTGSLTVLNQLVTSAPLQTARLTPEIVPILAEAIWDTKADVKKAAKDSLERATALVSNKDIEHFIPALIKALINPVEEVPKTINLLSATTFVSEVDSATLSLMVPLLSRGLSEKPTATKRRVAVIIDNMAKLVDSAVTVRPFIPKLLPGLLKVETTIGDREARSVVGRAVATLRQVGDVPADNDGSDFPPLKKADEKQLAHSLLGLYKKAGAEAPSAGSIDVMYASNLAANPVNAKNFNVSEWQSLAPYLAFVTTTPEPIVIVNEWVVKSASLEDEDTEVPEDEEEGEDLCNCQFSLAYGAKILLNTATLRLKRGHRYGLCGCNGTGKSTLMRAITNGQVEGFPSPDEVRTFYVEHDIDGWRAGGYRDARVRRLQRREAEAGDWQSVWWLEDEARSHARDVVQG